jgi:type I restriction enzyme, S subunit
MANRKVQLAELCDVIKGVTGIKKAIPGKYPMVVTAEKRITHNEYQFDSKAVIIPLVSSTGHGHASLKRVHYQEGKFAIGSILAAVIVKNEEVLHPYFLYIYLSYFKDELLVPLMKGSANVSLNPKKINTVEITLPSMKRQLEIIDLEKNRTKINEIEVEIQTQKELVKQLQQLILQDAIQGKLTEDWRKKNPDVEPARELLEKVKAEKEQLIKDKKIKKEKLLPPITDEKIPFELPEGWVWCRLIDISLFINGDRSENYPSGADIVIKGIPFFNSKSIYNDRVNIDNKDLQYITKGKFDSLGGGKLKLNDILMVLRGSSRGKAGLFSESKITGFINAQLIIIRGLSDFYHEYFISFFKTSFFYNQADKVAGGSAQPHISGKDLKEVLIPLPPLEEQQAIVLIISHIMQKCYRLEKEIGGSESSVNMLMQAVLKEAFER